MIDKELLAYLAKSEQCLGRIISTGVKSHLLDFDNHQFSPIRALFDAFGSFYMTYRKLIDRAHLPQHLEHSGLKEDQIKEILLLYEEILNLTYEKEFDFLVDSARKNYAKSILQHKLDFGIDLLVDNKIDKAIHQFKEGIFAAENVFNDQSQEGVIRDSVHTRETIYEEKMNGIRKIGLPTGFPTFDRCTGGLKGGELIVIASGSREGKSTFLLNVAHHLQANFGKNIFFVSAENPKEQLERRYDSLHSGVRCDQIRDGTLSPEDYEHYKRALADIKSRAGTFFIWDQPVCTPEGINAKLLELEPTIIFDAVFVDYLGLIKPEKVTNAAWRDTGNVAMGLRTIGRKRGIPVVTANQTNRDASKRHAAQYELTDFSNSYEVVYHADTILTIRAQNLDVLNSGMGICELKAVIQKCRDGSQGEFIIDATFSRMKMDERLCTMG